MSKWICASILLGLVFVVGCNPYPPQPQQPIIVNPPAQNNYYNRPATPPPAPRVYVNPWPWWYPWCSPAPAPHCPPPYHHHPHCR